MSLDLTAIKARREKQYNWTGSRLEMIADIDALLLEVERLQALEKAINDTLPLGVIALHYTGSAPESITCELTVYNEDAYEFYYNGVGEDIATAIKNAVDNIDWIEGNED